MLVITAAAARRCFGHRRSRLLLKGVSRRMLLGVVVDVSVIPGLVHVRLAMRHRGKRCGEGRDKGEGQGQLSRQSKPEHGGNLAQRMRRRNAGHSA